MISRRTTIMLQLRSTCMYYFAARMITHLLLISIGHIQIYSYTIVHLFVLSKAIDYQPFPPGFVLCSSAALNACSICPASIPSSPCRNSTPPPKPASPGILIPAFPKI